MTDNTLLTPEQFARDLAETISRQFQTRVSIQLNRHQPEHTHLHVHLAQPLTLPLQHLSRRYQEHPEELQKLIAFELQRISEHTIRRPRRTTPKPSCRKSKARAGCKNCKNNSPSASRKKN